MADVLDAGPAAPPEPTPEAAAGAAPSPPRTLGAIEAAVAVESGVRRKQAVVVVHGIGEQRPLETLRAFVETVYRRDLGLTVKGDDTRINDPDLGELNRTWVVPDEATGTVELRRITTPPNQDGVRTDFFEFYWADIMDSTPLELVTGWIRGLLVRSPFNVPLRAPVYIAWVMLWILTILMAAFAFAIVEPEKGPFLAFVTNIVNTLAPWREWILKGAAALGLAMLAYQFGKTIVDRAIALRRMKTGVPMQGLGQTLPKFGPSLMTALAGAAAYFLLAVDATANAKIWAGGLTALAGVVIAGLVVPYVGDIARFARPTPATIAKAGGSAEAGADAFESTA